MSIGKAALTIFVLVSVVNVNFIVNAIQWNYQQEGPDFWEHEFESCAGKLQSPINLESSLADYSKLLKDINFFNYNLNFTWNITNNGHTIQGNLLPTNNVPYITGSDFTETFYLAQFHFHWGYNIYQGSEHYINREKYPLEIHLVHKSASDRLAVIGFMYQISEKNNTNLSDLVRIVADNNQISESSTGKIALTQLLPDLNVANSVGYFRYNGSLTTPPCTEGVIWTVYETKVNISEAQMQSFYQNIVEINFRDIQELNDRPLWFSKKKKGSFFNQLYNSATTIYQSLVDLFKFFRFEQFSFKFKYSRKKKQN